MKPHIFGVRAQKFVIEGFMSNKTAIVVDRWVAERVREFIEVEILTYITATAGGKADSEA